MRRRSAIPAVFAVVLLVVGQLGALAHEAAARHITCEEHGEELEAATLVDALDSCDHGHWIGVEGTGGDHEDCAIARALRTTTTGALHAPAIRVAVAQTAAAPPPAATGVLPLALYLIAPKTSPPTAGAPFVS